MNAITVWTQTIEKDDKGKYVMPTDSKVYMESESADMPYDAQADMVYHQTIASKYAAIYASGSKVEQAVIKKIGSSGAEIEMKTINRIASVPTE